MSARDGPPPGYRFDAFADARMGLSLFQMRDADWLVRDSDGSPQGGDGEAGSVHDSAGPQGIAQPPAKDHP